MMNPNVQMQPGIILLRDGTDDSQGKAQLISNINACQAVAEAVRTTLGPRGMDKLIHDGSKVSHTDRRTSLMRSTLATSRGLAVSWRASSREPATSYTSVFPTIDRPLTMGASATRHRTSL